MVYRPSLHIYRQWLFPGWTILYKVRYIQQRKWQNVLGFFFDKKEVYLYQIKMRLSPKDCANTIPIFRDNAPYFEYYMYYGCGVVKSIKPDGFYDMFLRSTL